MLTRWDDAAGKDKLLYPDDLLARLFDEQQKKLRTFRRVWYETEQTPRVESWMRTFRGKIFRYPPNRLTQRLVQCAGNVASRDDIPKFGLINPRNPPEGFFMKQDSSTSGKLSMDGLVDYEKALYGQLQSQLGVSRADVRLLVPPVAAKETSSSFLFPGLVTHFDNVTYFLEMLSHAYKPQYVQVEEKNEKTQQYPVTISTWLDVV